jgi:hypothetical protein
VFLIIDAVRRFYVLIGSLCLTIQVILHGIEIHSHKALPHKPAKATENLHTPLTFYFTITGTALEKV